MSLKYLPLVLLLRCVDGELCPKQCDCDTVNGLNRATCVDQNIVDIDVGVPKHVEIYSLSRNMITELDNLCFKEIGFVSLRELTLSYNGIFWIGLHAFSGLDKLEHLDLSSNRLRSIPSDLFWDTPQLTSLDLSSNVFESLKNEPFIMHGKLQVLNLKNCRIKSIPERMFTRLPYLKKLDLSDNYMTTITIDAFRPLRRLDKLLLANEYWNCDPNLMAVESWIVFQRIAYDIQCQKKTINKSEKIISVVSEERAEVDVKDVWNIAEVNITVPVVKSSSPKTPFQKLDHEFSALQAFIIGTQLGLAFGIVGTYIWLRRFCTCGKLDCTEPQTPRQRRRVQRIRDNDMRANLLWNNVMGLDMDTPPSYRRQASLPDRSPPTYGVPVTTVAALQVDAIRLPDRSETPPPPYHECRIDL